MWIRLLLAPSWVSWIATALLTAAFVGPIWLLLQRPDTDIGWPIFAAATGFGVLMATLATIAQRPTRRTMANAVNGLDRAGRAQAITATRHGEMIPTDPHILAAAIELCTASLGDRARHSPSGWWPKIIPWIGPAIFTSIVILNLAAGDYRKAIGYGGVSAFIAATSWWSTHAGNRTQERLDRMKAAAAEHNSTTAATDT